jgi:hypothetical protein
VSLLTESVLGSGQIDHTPKNSQLQPSVTQTPSSFATAPALIQHVPDNLRTPLISKATPPLSSPPTRHGREHEIPKSITHGSSLRLVKDISRFTELLNETSPSAALQFLKEHWRVVLFGSGTNVEHLEYILKAGLKNVTSKTINNLLADKSKFAEVFLKKAGATASANKAIVIEILEHVTPLQVATHVPQAVLDSVFEDRIRKAAAQPQLPTPAPDPDPVHQQGAITSSQIIEQLKLLEAREIVNILASAHRLGFNKDDIIDPVDETIRPNITTQYRLGSQPLSNGSYILAPSDRDPLLVEQDPNEAAVRQASKVPTIAHNPSTSAGLMHCPYCAHPFDNKSVYSYVS